MSMTVFACLDSGLFTLIPSDIVPDTALKKNFLCIRIYFKLNALSFLFIPFFSSRWSVPCSLTFAVLLKIVAFVLWGFTYLCFLCSHFDLDLRISKSSVFLYPLWLAAHRPERLRYIALVVNAHMSLWWRFITSAHLDWAWGPTLTSYFFHYSFSFNFFVSRRILMLYESYAH